MNITFNTHDLINKIKNIAPTAEAKQTLAILGNMKVEINGGKACLLYTSPSPRDLVISRMPSSA